MGQAYVVNARGRIIEKIDEKIQDLDTLLHQRNFLCDTIYDIIHIITDETELEAIE